MLLLLPTASAAAAIMYLEECYCQYNAIMIACRHFKVFVITLSMGWIQQQKKTTLDAKYKLPKMPYKGDRISTQIMRIQQKSLVTEMQDMVEEPEFPLLTKRRPITVPGPPKGTTVRPDSAQAATSSSQPQQSQDVSSSQQTSRASTSMPATSRQQSNNSGKTYGKQPWLCIKTLCVEA